MRIFCIVLIASLMAAFVSGTVATVEDICKGVLGGDSTATYFNLHKQPSLCVLLDIYCRGLVSLKLIGFQHYVNIPSGHCMLKWNIPISDRTNEDYLQLMSLPFWVQFDVDGNPLINGSPFPKSLDPLMKSHLLHVNQLNYFKSTELKFSAKYTNSIYSVYLVPSLCIGAGNISKLILPHSANQQFTDNLVNINFKKLSHIIYKSNVDTMLDSVGMSMLKIVLGKCGQLTATTEKFTLEMSNGQYTNEVSNVLKSFRITSLQFVNILQLHLLQPNSLPQSLQQFAIYKPKILDSSELISIFNAISGLNELIILSMDLQYIMTDNILNLDTVANVCRATLLSLPKFRLFDIHHTEASNVTNFATFISRLPAISGKLPILMRLPKGVDPGILTGSMFVAFEMPTLI